MANMDYLVIEDIHKSFYGVEVLKGVSFFAISFFFLSSIRRKGPLTGRLEIMIFSATLRRSNSFSS